MEENSKHKIAFKGTSKKKESEVRSVHIDFKCTKEEKEKIIKKAYTLTVSEYVRRTALGKSLKIMCKSDKEMLKTISKIGVNLNQIARVLNITKDPDEFKKFKKDLDEMTAELKGIYLTIRGK